MLLVVPVFSCMLSVVFGALLAVVEDWPFYVGFYLALAGLTQSQFPVVDGDYKVEKPDQLEAADITEAQRITLTALKLSNFKKKNASVTQLRKGLCETRIKVMARQNYQLFNKKLPLARENAVDVYQMIGMPGYTGKKLTFDR